MTKRFVKGREALSGKAVQEHGSPDRVANGKQQESKRLAKSVDPAFTKFTTYIKKATHIGVKTRLVSMEMELSDLVEELLSNWLRKNESFKAKPQEHQ